MTRYGYARVSTAKQDLSDQVAQLEAHGIDRSHIEAEVISSRKAKRVALERVLEELKEGDELHVVELSRLGRSMEELGTLGKTLEEKGVRLGVGGAVYDPSTFEGRTIFLVLSMVAELEREFIADRTRRRLAQMKADGKQIGRKPALTKRQATEAKKAYDAGLSKSTIAAKYGVSRATITKAVEGAADAERIETDPELRRTIREQEKEQAAAIRRLEAAKRAADEEKAASTKEKTNA